VGVEGYTKTTMAKKQITHTSIGNFGDGVARYIHRRKVGAEKEKIKLLH
jgi:hypothetical protein